MTRADVPCPLCRSEDRVRLFVSRLYAEEVPIVRCAACGLLHQSPRPSPADLLGMYDEKYYTGAGAKPGDYTYADEREHAGEARDRTAARLARVETFVRPGKVVDAGCSFGAFLTEARHRGWDPCGVDASPYAAAHLRDALRIPVHEGTFETAPIASGSVRLVHMSEFLEHCPDPRAVVKTAARVLEPGGLLVVGTANADSLARLLRGPRWGYYMPGHVVFFSARLLGRLLAEEGFVPVRLFRGDDRGGLLDPGAALLHAVSVPGRLVRALPLPRGWTVGAGMVVYARRGGK